MSVKHVAVGIFGAAILVQLSFIQVLLYMAVFADKPGPPPIEVRVVAPSSELAPLPGDSGAALRPTGDPLDLAIDGRGFFQVELPDGRRAYTRHGDFHINSDGLITSSEGFPLSPAIAVPEDYTSIEVRYDGTISTLDSRGTRSEVGRITLARFMNPEGLQRWRGRGLCLETEASGAPTEAAPGTEGFGPLEQGLLESSDETNPTEALTLTVSPGSGRPGVRIVDADGRLLTPSV